MKLAWLTDIHLNFLEKEERAVFYQNIIKTSCDAVLISGDIAEAPSICPIMLEMRQHLSRKIYFVLGNHDYYRGSIDSVRAEVTTLCQNEPFLHWLSTSGSQTLAENTILLGEDGWADGRIGDYNNSMVVLNDSRLIADLYSEKTLGKNNLLQKMQQLADADASKLETELEQALQKNPKKIIVVTHLPPFKESCMHEGKVSNDDFLPFFSCKAIGDVLTKVSTENPRINFLVLCGHTHSDSVFRPADNLLIKAGNAEYYRPTVQEVFDID